MKGAASHLIRSVEDGLSAGQHEFKLAFQDHGEGLYPNIALPIAGAIDFYATQRHCNFYLAGQGTSRYPWYVAKMGVLRPYRDTAGLGDNLYLDKVWRFDTENLFSVVSGLVSSIRQAVVLEPGVLNILELCLNEVADNVLMHSNPANADQAYGFVMAQVHKLSGRIAVCVYDNGMGIPASLQDGGVACSDAADAIALAMKRGVTDGKGAGNGLWMLRSAVDEGLGSLEIVTDGTRYALIHKTENDCRESFSKVISPTRGTTLVDFQLDSLRSVDVESITGHIGFVDYWKEAREDDSDGESLRLMIAQEAKGLGSRHDGESLRCLMLNAANQVTGPVILDFSDIEIISLSFADEIVRKTIDYLGQRQFMRQFRFEHVNRACGNVIDAVMSANHVGNRAEVE